MPETGEQKRQRVARNLAKLKAAQRPQEEIDQYLASEEERVAPERGMADQIGAGAQAFSDAATFGLSGLADDAISAFGKSTFAENRAARKANKEALPGGVRTALELAGGLATPIPGGTLLKGAANTAKWTTRAGRGALDAALQAGIGGAVGNVDDLSAEGLTSALKEGGKSALLGASVAAPLGAAAGMGTRLAKRAAKAEKLDEKAVALQKEMRAADAVNYPVALTNWGMPLTPKMQAVLKNPQVREIVGDLRQLEQWKGVKANDPKFLDAVYKELSDWGRELDTPLTAPPTRRANLTRAKKENVGLLKEQFLDAADQQLPGYRDAVSTHAGFEKKLDVHGEAADVARGVGSGKSLPGRKLRTESRAAYRENVIPKLSADEAELALGGMLGRGREAFHITNSPLGLFGLMSSAVRTPMTMLRTGPLVRELEAKVGRGRLGQGASDVVRGSLARALGAMGAR